MQVPRRSPGYRLKIPGDPDGISPQSPATSVLTPAENVHGMLRPGKAGGLRRFLQLNYAATYRDNECLCAIVGAELVHNVPHVSLYRFLGDEELLCDVTVAISFH
jgi:hypothetical protein